jgi:hypothetical protein
MCGELRVAAPPQATMTSRDSRLTTHLLREFGPEIFVVDGPVVSFFGFAYPTRMAAVRLSNGELFI